MYVYIVTIRDLLLSIIPGSNGISVVPNSWARFYLLVLAGGVVVGALICTASFWRTVDGGEITLLEAGKRGLCRLDPPSGGRPGLVKHQVATCSTQLNALVT